MLAALASSSADRPRDQKQLTLDKSTPHMSSSTTNGGTSPYLETPNSTDSSGSSRLTTPRFEDSPGSSIFDLPVNPDITPALGSTRTSYRATPPTSTPTADTDIQPGDSGTKRSATPSVLVISGGTGCNSICSAFRDACYVLPVSDDGGSSSEIIRVLGGPSIGDIRSRLVRLIPPSPEGSPLDRIGHLLAYRLSAESSEREAREEWRNIVEGRSSLWTGIPPDRKEVIRGFLVYFESEILRRAQKNFSFRNGSVGNYFLAAARIFFRSLPSAIFLFSSITSSQANIVPVLVTNHIVTIAVELENGRNVVGQCNISHPTQSESSFSLAFASPIDDPAGPVSPSRLTSEHSHSSKNLVFSKEDEVPLEARISRMYYINAYGNEIHPSPNPDFLLQCGAKDILVYSCGSLWTSVIPCLALKGVASAIARSRTLRAKVLLLNSKNDRETKGYTAVDYIKAITRTLNVHYASQGSYTSYPVSAFITHLVHLRDGQVPLDVDEVSSMGVHCVEVEPKHGSSNRSQTPLFDAECVRTALQHIMGDLETRGMVWK